MDLHAGQIQGFLTFVDHLNRRIFHYFLGKNLIDAVVVSPTWAVLPGRELAERLKLPIAIITKGVRTECG